MSSIFPRWNIAVQKTGSDFAEYISDMEAKARERGVIVIQVWLGLSSPWIEEVVEALRGKRYFLGFR